MTNLTSHSILVIDDEAAILRLLEFMLTKKGKIVDTAQKGEEGLTKIQSNHYDLVLTDIKMPGISGVEVLHTIKELKGDDVPVIGMSGTPWMLEHTEFDAVISKPYTMQNLFETIRTIIPSF